MPKMGDAMTEGKVLRWMKAAGDPVQSGEAIAEIETDKVNVELPAEEAGVLAEILVAEGATAAVGAPIAVIKPTGAGPVSAGSAAQAAAPVAPPAREAGPAPAGETAARAPAKQVPARVPPEERFKASPLARRLARERGIDLAAVQGTGPEGRITKEDVEAYIARRGAAASATPAAEDVPLTRMRRTIARRMSESKQQAPHFYVAVEILMDEALALRARVNADRGEKLVSVNDLILKAAALALRAFPNLNATFGEEAVRRHGEIHIGFALALPEGLIVPVVRHCDRKSLAEIARETTDLAARAGAGRLRPDELQGATFTVSNLGMYDVEGFIAIINPPQAAILAVGTAQPRVVTDGTAIRIAHMLKATISADHRVTDGAEAARYLSEFKRLLQSPSLLTTS